MIFYNNFWGTISLSILQILFKVISGLTVCGLTKESKLPFITELGYFGLGQEIKTHT